MHLSYEFGLPTMTNCHLGNCTGGQSSQGSLRSNLGRKGTHTKVYKLPVKPYPNFGYCGCTVKLEWYRIQTTISFIKGKGSCLNIFIIKIIWCSRTHVKTFQ